MREKGLLKRIIWVLAGACAFMVFVSLMQSEATPIPPDLNRLLQEAERERTEHFPLARAGWNGPEGTQTSQAADSVYNQFGPEASARHARASLLAAATPDYRAVAGILLVILLLRRMRQPARRVPVHAASSGEAPIAIQPAGRENPRNPKRVA